MHMLHRCPILAMSLFLYLVLSVVATGGEISTAVGARNKPDTNTNNPLEQMTVEELRAYQAFYYVSGSRDPLTMRLPTSRELGEETRSLSTRVAPTLDQMEIFLTTALNSIKANLKVLDYDKAIKAAEDALFVIDNEWPPIQPEHVHLLRMTEEIRNYHSLAARLKTQEEIKKEFASLSLKVDGVIWSPTDAKAVVNGRTMAAGEVMLNERKQGDLRLELIEEHGVVLQFKGMRFRKPVEMLSN